MELSGKEMDVFLEIKIGSTKVKDPTRKVISGRCMG